MAFFNSKLRYALCAATDLAMRSDSDACQSREIAARQDIPGPYLDQILASLKSAGIVSSIRGAGGGYRLARTADRIRVGDIVRAVLREDRLFSCNTEEEPPEVDTPGVAWVVREMEENVERLLTERLDSITLADLVQRKRSLNDTLSFMPSI